MPTLICRLFHGLRRTKMVILGLGTNLGDREQTLRQAVLELKALLSQVICSPVYESPALLPETAPKDWDMPFLNMAVRGESTFTPKALLAEIQALERKLGREKRGHWSPREIDIDILACDGVIINEPTLTVPHQALLKRDFALIPLADIVPEWVYPGRDGKMAHELATQMASQLKRTDLVIA